MTRPANSPGGDNAREPLDSSVSTHDDQDVWLGEQHFDIEGGVGHVEDNGFTHYDCNFASRHYHAYTVHGDGTVGLSIGYDDGDAEFGALVNLAPDEARRLASLLEDAADYQENREPTTTTDDDARGKDEHLSPVERMREVLFG